MSSLKTNKDSLERIFASLKAAAVNRKDPEMYLNEQIEYASVIFNNEIIVKILGGLLASRYITEEVYKHVVKWFFLGKENEKEKRLRYLDHDQFKRHDIKRDFTLIQRLHFKLIEELDDLIRGDFYRGMYFYNAKSRIGKLNLDDFETIEFKGERAEVIDFLYKNRGDNWFSYKSEGLQRFKAKQLEDMVKDINKRVEKETDFSVDGIITIKPKPKNNPRFRGEYMWAI